MTELRTTPLYEDHRRMGARFVEFFGWRMPVQFAGVIPEHLAVRERAGLFDVSHMGEVMYEGPGALDAVNHVLTNDVAAIEDGQALYSTMCTPEGGIVDDVIAYRFSQEKILVVVNASNVEKDFAWMSGHNPTDAQVTNRSDELAQLAIQGPEARGIAAQVLGASISDMPPFRHTSVSFEGHDVMVATTGYTGEDGYELYAPNAVASPLLCALFEVGEPKGLVPVGLGARDSLRLEMKFALYGNDIDETTNPIEAGLGWTVKLDKQDFVGKQAIAAIKERGITRKLIGFKMVDRGIARHGAVVEAEGEEVGHVTSGTMSPSLKEAIGLAYLPKKMAKRNKTFTIRIRKDLRTAKVVRTPFVRKK
jgi:aminomethyltransferase